jgi:hypothetical protein
MFKAIDKWLIGYLKSVLVRPRRGAGPRHLLFCLCDHFEPFRGGTNASDARRLVEDWLAAYPNAVRAFRDADGRGPCHTFFYPQEDYDEEILDRMADFCRQGYGEVEIHLHHRHDTAAGFRQKLESFRDVLHTRHGLLGQLREADSAPPASRRPPPTPRYGFIHGNWSLCNSRPDGDWCGVNEELGILAETGCYADFTFPSAPSPTQPGMVNALYYATDTPGKPRAADRGCRAERGKRQGGHGRRGSDYRLPLLLITGPIALNWACRKWGVLPRLENGEISGANPPTGDRIRLWARQGIHVAGRPEWVFVKVHTHGCVPGNKSVILGEAMREAHATLRREFNDGRDWKLHYVTAREMYNLVKAAETGAEGEPGPWKDYEVVRKG